MFVGRTPSPGSTTACAPTTPARMNLFVQPLGCCRERKALSVPYPFGVHGQLRNLINPKLSAEPGRGCMPISHFELYGYPTGVKGRWCRNGGSCRVSFRVVHDGLRSSPRYAQTSATRQALRPSAKVFIWQLLRARGSFRAHTQQTRLQRTERPVHSQPERLGFDCGWKSLYARGGGSTRTSCGSDGLRMLKALMIAIIAAPRSLIGCSGVCRNRCIGHPGVSVCLIEVWLIWRLVLAARTLGAPDALIGASGSLTSNAQ